MNNRGLAYGSDAEILPHAATANNVFCLYADNLKHEKLDVCGEDLSIFAAASFDYIYIGQRLCNTTDPIKTFEDLVSKLRRNGHLILLQAPRDAEEEEAITKLIASTGAWLRKDYKTLVVDGVKWVLQIYKKVKGKPGIAERAIDSRPKACIVRYGAMGDMIMLTPLIKQLHLDGYHITLNITKYAAPIIEQNPYVDNIVLQEKDAIPNVDLGEYWGMWEKEYDRYINLSESIEGTLLKVEGRRDFYTTQAWRHEQCNKNYFDFTMALAGYPSLVGTRGEMFFSAAEEAEARRFRQTHKDKFLIVWALAGSSFHKLYGLFQPVANDYLNTHPEAVIVTVGDQRGMEQEFNHPRLIRGCGQWSIRQSLALTKVADLVIGPESVVINAAGCFDTPKITLLSHSSHENLCKHFVNDYCLAPNKEFAPCYGDSGCHQLHYFFNGVPSCPIVRIVDDKDREVLKGPACAMGAIEGGRLLARINEVQAKHWAGATAAAGDPIAVGR